MKTLFKNISICLVFFILVTIPGFGNAQSSGNSFKTVAWTANGVEHAITGVGFKPDLIWGKKRSNVDSNVLVDVVRGNTKEVYSDTQSAEVTNVNGVLSFDTDGFTLAGYASGSGVWNGNTGHTHVAWCWKAGDESVSNTDGTITSTEKGGRP
jgi:hypothetical protein